MSTTNTPQKRFNSDQENMDCNTPVRRSGRRRTPSSKIKQLQEYTEMVKRTPRSNKSKNTIEQTDSSSANEVSDENLEENIEVPEGAASILFNHDKDVAGNQLYTFRTPKKRDGMKLLAANTPKTPSSDLKALSLNSPRTPKIHRKITNATAKTPHEARNKIKTAIHKQVKRYTQSDDDDDDEDNDFSADEDSDYDGHDDESSQTEDSDGESSYTGRDTKSKRNILAKPSTSNVVEASTSLRPGLRTRSRQPAQKTEFIPNSDDYFNTISSKKNKTSNNTLDKLKSSRLQFQDLFTILKSIRLSEEHQKRILEMNEDLVSHFDRWMLEMSQGYNIITYGLGSKQQLLYKFCERHLGERPLVYINGFFPTMTIKEILQAIKGQVLESNVATRNDHEIVDLIANTLRGFDDCHLFLVINNIDGPLLRKTKDQHILSRLAKIKNIHLIASVDHINSPLMWDQTCMDNYNFVWYDCTTMLPYEQETAFENSVFLQNSSDMDLAAMHNVFQSLTTNARGIYMILVKAQLDNQKDSTYQGMPFKDFYRKCREGFLVSSDLALRTQLIEFVDHNMAKLKRSNDGTEHVSIPINPKILQLFNQQQKE